MFSSDTSPHSKRRSPPSAKPLALEPFAHAGLAQNLHAGVLENSGADSLFAIGARLRFQYDGVDSSEVKQVREHQSRGTCSNDADLCLEPRHALPITSPGAAR